MGFSYVHALGELPYLIGMILTAWWKLNSDPREQQDLLASLWPPRANHLNAHRVWFWYIDDEWCESHEDHRASKPYVINRCPSEELHISNIWEILAPRDVVHGRPGEDSETKLFNLCRNWERGRAMVTAKEVVCRPSRAEGWGEHVERVQRNWWTSSEEEIRSL